MAQLDKRERKNAALFYFIAAFATIIWWLTLIILPESRTLFLGKTFAEHFTWILLAPDLILALIIAIFLAPYVIRGNPNAPALAWLYAGGQAYAFAIAFALTLIDPDAYWGTVGMALAAGISLFLAIRLEEFDILWGKFKFKPAPHADPKTHWQRALIQTVVMWSLFLGVIPAAIAAFEIHFRFNQNWFHFPVQLPLAIAIFVILGSIGLYSCFVMTKHGDGTPLPSEHTNQLVILGPYRYIRNPMALCGISQGGIVGLAIGSPLIIVYSILGALSWEILVRPLEEAELASRFGDEYPAYQKAVKCWLPSLRPYSQSR